MIRMWLLKKLLAFYCYKAMENPFASKDCHLDHTQSTCTQQWLAAQTELVIFYKILFYLLFLKIVREREVGGDSGRI